MAVDCPGDDCVDANVAASLSVSSSSSLPYVIIIVTLVLCSILLATIALIIVVVISRDRRKRLESLGESAISYEDLAKPGLSTVEVQPDMRTLDLRGNHRGGFMPYTGPRRLVPQGQIEGQRRLNPVPEEEGNTEDGSHDNFLNLPACAYEDFGDAYGEDGSYVDDEEYLSVREEQHEDRRKQRGHSNCER